MPLIYNVISSSLAITCDTELAKALSAIELNDINNKSKKIIWKQGDNVPDTVNYYWEYLILRFKDDFDLLSYVKDNKLESSIIILIMPGNSSSSENSRLSGNSRSRGATETGMKQTKLTLKQYENIESRDRENGLVEGNKYSGLGPPFMDSNNRWKIAYMVKGPRGIEYYMISGASSEQAAVDNAKRQINSITNSRLQLR